MQIVSQLRVSPRVRQEDVIGKEVFRRVIHGNEDRSGIFDQRTDFRALSFDIVAGTEQQHFATVQRAFQASDRRLVIAIDVLIIEIELLGVFRIVHQFLVVDDRIEDRRDLPD